MKLRSNKGTSSDVCTPSRSTGPQLSPPPPALLASSSTKMTKKKPKTKMTKKKPKTKKKTINKPKFCPFPNCKRFFKYQKDVKRHLLSTHTDLKPFKCPVCSPEIDSSSFNRRDNLYRHVRTRHRYNKKQVEAALINVIKVCDVALPVPPLPIPVTAPSALSTPRPESENVNNGPEPTTETLDKTPPIEKIITPENVNNGPEPTAETLDTTPPIQNNTTEENVNGPKPTVAETLDKTPPIQQTAPEVNSSSCNLSASTSSTEEKITFPDNEEANQKRVQLLPLDQYTVENYNFFRDYYVKTEDYKDRNYFGFRRTKMPNVLPSNAANPSDMLPVGFVLFEEKD